MNHGRILSPVLQQVVNQYLRLTESPDRDRTRWQHLCEDVGTLSRRFTKERGAVSESYLTNARLRDAYLAYFFPVNLAKVQALLEELPPEALFQELGRPLKVLDIGSGPGTAALAVMDWMQGLPDIRRRAVETVMVDQASPALVQARHLWEAYAQASGESRSKLTIVQADLQRTGALDPAKDEAGGPFDVIVIANVLNELWREERDMIDRRAAFVAALVDRLAPHGSLILIEPALRDTSRELHRVRDRLVLDGTYTVYSPCLHEQACPALIHEGDWCHEERAWTPPLLVSAIDHVVGFIKDALKFSYVILRKDGRTIVPRQPNVFRIVSELREMKGEKRAWLCNETGRPEVGRQDRLRSESNAAVDEWHRGAIVRISEIERKQRKGREATVGRIPSSSVVEIIRSISE